MRNLRKHIIYVCFTAFMSVTSWAVADDKPACYHQAIGGDKEAQYQLAEIYRIGKEIEQDWKLAFQWYKKSAEQDYTPAMHALALCLIDGYGTGKKQRRV